MQLNILQIHIDKNMQCSIALYCAWELVHLDERIFVEKLHQKLSLLLFLQTGLTDLNSRLNIIFSPKIEGNFGKLENYKSKIVL